MEHSNNPDLRKEKILKQDVQTGTSVPLARLIEGYRLGANSEGKSQNTIAIVEASVRYLEEFLASQGLYLDVKEIGPNELRRFVVYLQQRPCFANHRFTKPQTRRLSAHTVNGYMRALQSFWAWLERESFIEENPFTKIKIPRAPKKVIPIFSEEQLRQIFQSIDIASPAGYRDYTIILTLLDTGIRCSELTGLRLTDVNLNSRLLKVWGKGGRERLVPIGARAQNAIWKYINRYRPEPAIPRYDHLFITPNGHPLTKDRLEAIVERYGIKAGITGIRVSPHTFRHTMAVTFLRNRGDVFSLQRILGHSQLEVLRGYVNLAQSDISRVHQRSSPAENFEFAVPKPGATTRLKSRKATGSANWRESQATRVFNHPVNHLDHNSTACHPKNYANVVLSCRKSLKPPAP